MKPTASLLISCLALAGVAAGTTPAAAQSPAPPITVDGGEPAGDSPTAGSAAAGGAEQATPPAVKPPAAPATAKKKTGEVLPWANKPLTPAAAPTGDVAAVDAAAAQCGGLFEAACRDLKTCAWIADVALQDGTQIPARCVARPPAPPKNAAKKTAPAKKAAKAPEASETQGAAAPAVKAAVTRVEDEGSPEAPAAAEKKTKHEPDSQAAATPPEEKAPEQPKAPHQAESKAPEKKAEEAKAPIVVKPPPAPAAQMPSFGSVQPVMPGGGDAVVVTVPPSE